MVSTSYPKIKATEVNALKLKNVTSVAFISGHTITKLAESKETHLHSVGFDRKKFQLVKDAFRGAHLTLLTCSSLENILHFYASTYTIVLNSIIHIVYKHTIKVMLQQ